MARTSLRDRGLRLAAGMSVLALTFLCYCVMNVGLRISAIQSNVLPPAAMTAPLSQLQYRGRS